MPKTSSGGQILGFKMSNSRGREEKLRQKKGRKKKEEKTWKHEKPPRFCGGFSWPSLTIKLGKIEIFDQKVPTSWGLPAYVYAGRAAWGPSFFKKRAGSGST